MPLYIERPRLDEGQIGRGMLSYANVWLHNLDDTSVISFPIKKNRSDVQVQLYCFHVR